MRELKAKEPLEKTSMASGPELAGVHALDDDFGPTGAARGECRSRPASLGREAGDNRSVTSWAVNGLE
jgi:hypothetical protein